MKKLKLNLQQLEGAEVLTRAQLKTIWAGMMVVAQIGHAAPLPPALAILMPVIIITVPIQLPQNARELLMTGVLLMMLVVISIALITKKVFF